MEERTGTTAGNLCSLPDVLGDDGERRERGGQRLGVGGTIDEVEYPLDRIVVVTLPVLPVLVAP